MVYYNTSTLNFPLMFYSLIRELKDLAWTDASQGARERQNGEILFMALVSTGREGS